MDRSAQNCDRSSECEIMNLRRMKFVFDVAPLEIIDDKELFEEEDEDFFHGVFASAAAAAALMMNMNQISLVIQTVNHDFISQYWSLKSDQQQQLQLNSSSSSSSSCHGQHDHRDHHHLRDEDDDEEMIMIACQPPPGPPETSDLIIVLDRARVFASSAAAAADDYIMSKLRVLDLLYEIEWIFKQEQLEEVKRCIIQRISEAKPDPLLLAKPNAVRIRVDLSTIFKRYYANPAAAASAYAEKKLYNITTVAEDFAIHYSAAAAAAPPTFYDDDDDDKPSRTPLTTALRSSKEALETKILEEEDLISSSSSSSCSVCLNEFHVGVDEIKKMPCSHVFHWNCLMNWLLERNTCPLCYYKLPTFSTRFLENRFP